MADRVLLAVQTSQLSRPMTTSEALSSLRAFQFGDGPAPKDTGSAINHAITVLAKLDYWQSATDAQMRQLAGELSAQEIRNIRAVLAAIHHVS